MSVISHYAIFHSDWHKICRFCRQGSESCEENLHEQMENILAKRKKTKSIFCILLAAILLFATFVIGVLIGRASNNQKQATAVNPLNNNISVPFVEIQKPSILNNTYRPQNWKNNANESIYQTPINSVKVKHMNSVHSLDVASGLYNAQKLDLLFIEEESPPYVSPIVLFFVFGQPMLPENPQTTLFHFANLKTEHWAAKRHEIDCLFPEPARIKSCPYDNSLTSEDAVKLRSCPVALHNMRLIFKKTLAYAKSDVTWALHKEDKRNVLWDRVITTLNNLRLNDEALQFRKLITENAKDTPKSNTKQ